MATLTQKFDSDRLSRFQRMKDDAIVNRYMAQIDTRIDSFVLACRVTDAEVDAERAIRYSDSGALHTYWLYDRPLDRLRIHEEREPDLQEMIEQIREDNFEYIEPERSFEHRFGPYEGNSDQYLAYVLDMAGPDYADEEDGSTEWAVWAARYGRIVLLADDRGFKTLDIHDNEDDAINQMENISKQYGEWMEAENA